MAVPGSRRAADRAAGVLVVPGSGPKADPKGRAPGTVAPEKLARRGVAATMTPVSVTAETRDQAVDQVVDPEVDPEVAPVAAKTVLISVVDLDGRRGPPEKRLTAEAARAGAPVVEMTAELDVGTTHARPAGSEALARPQEAAGERADHQTRRALAPIAPVVLVSGIQASPRRRGIEGDDRPTDRGRRSRRSREAANRPGPIPAPHSNVARSSRVLR